MHVFIDKYKLCCYDIIRLVCSKFPGNQNFNIIAKLEIEQLNNKKVSIKLKTWLSAW